MVLLINTSFLAGSSEYHIVSNNTTHFWLKIPQGYYVCLQSEQLHYVFLGFKMCLYVFSDMFMVFMLFEDIYTVCYRHVCTLITTVPAWETAPAVIGITPVPSRMNQILTSGSHTGRSVSRSVQVCIGL